MILKDIIDKKILQRIQEDNRQRIHKLINTRTMCLNGLIIEITIKNIIIS